MFTRLRDNDLFRSANVVAGSIEWPGGLDLSYETLYSRGETVTGEVPTQQSEIEVRA